MQWQKKNKHTNTENNIEQTLGKSEEISVINATRNTLKLGLAKLSAWPRLYSSLRQKLSSIRLDKLLHHARFVIVHHAGRLLLPPPETFSRDKTALLFVSV